MSTAPLQIVKEELDTIDGVVDQCRAIKNLSGALHDTLQGFLLNGYRREERGGVHIAVVLSLNEIERILWIAENVADRAKHLNDRINVVYGAVEDIGGECAADGRTAA